MFLFGAPGVGKGTYAGKNLIFLILFQKNWLQILNSTTFQPVRKLERFSEVKLLLDFQKHSKKKSKILSPQEDLSMMTLFITSLKKKLRNRNPKPGLSWTVFQEPWDNSIYSIKTVILHIWLSIFLSTKESYYKDFQGEELAKPVDQVLTLLKLTSQDIQQINSLLKRKVNVVKKWNSFKEPMILKKLLKIDSLNIMLKLNQF